MDLGAWTNVVAIVGGLVTLVGGALGSAIWLGGWMERRQADHNKFTATDKKVGTLADNSTKAIRDLEKKFDDRHAMLDRKIDEHSNYDHERFDAVTETLADIQRTLGRIEGGLARRH